MSPLIAFALLGVVIAIGVLTIATQWPLKWNFNSGTDVFGEETSLLAIQRAAFIRLEVAVARNEHQLHRVLTVYRWSVALLGLEAALVVFGVIVS